jgi:molecular chaperone GrpE (heat shock protein)
MSKHSRDEPDAPPPAPSGDDPFAITETRVPVSPAVAAVDLRTAYADAVVSRGKLEDRLVETTRSAEAKLRKLVIDLLPVADALDAAVAMARTDQEKATATATRKLLGRALIRSGVERVNVMGTIADPEVVDVDGSEPARSLPPETVVREIVAAYRLQGVVLRRGVVVVAD